jgi:hypothetical protein
MADAVHHVLAYPENDKGILAAEQVGIIQHALDAFLKPSIPKGKSLMA